MKNINILYKFKLPSDELLEYPLCLNEDSLTLERPKKENESTWTALTFHQCPNCPLDTKEHKYCPVALNISLLMKDCHKLASYDEVEVEVTTPERIVSTKTSMQRALSSVLGLLIASSECPHTNMFKPMVRFHLPMSTEEETIYRVTSMYLLAQYFIYKDGGEPDQNFVGLEQAYKNIQQINKAMAQRLREASENDAAVNAVILLDLLAKALPYSIADSLQELKHLFKTYLHK